MADFAKENQFTPDQQAEIDAGIKDNIDVSIYAKPEFLAIQMHGDSDWPCGTDTGLLLCGQPV